MPLDELCCPRLYSNLCKQDSNDKKNWKKISAALKYFEPRHIFEDTEFEMKHHWH